MSLIGLSLNLLLAILLFCALVIGVRLERRLKSVREGQLAFAKAVADLDAAAVRAREGLADLRGATDEATDVLGGRIARAREAADRLESLVNRAQSVPSRPMQASAPAVPGPEGGLAALLERIQQAEIAPQTRPAAPNPQDRFADRPLRLRPQADDDLFEDLGGR